MGGTGTLLLERALQGQGAAALPDRKRCAFTHGDSHECRSTHGPGSVTVVLHQGLHLCGAAGLAMDVLIDAVELQVFGGEAEPPMRGLPPAAGSDISQASGVAQETRA